MEVDDRKNYLMLGLSISLLSHVSRSFLYLLALFGVIIVFNVTLKWLNKKKILLLGEGDVSAFNWLFLGFGLINPAVLVSFVVVWGVLTAVYAMGKAWVFKVKGPIPYFGVLLICFILVNWFFQIY